VYQNLAAVYLSVNRNNDVFVCGSRNLDNALGAFLFVLVVSVLWLVLQNEKVGVALFNSEEGTYFRKIKDFFTLITVWLVVSES